MKEAANRDGVSRASAPTPQILRPAGLAFALAKVRSGAHDGLKSNVVEPELRRTCPQIAAKNGKSSRHPSFCGKLQRRFARHDHPDSCSLARLGIQIDPAA